LNVWIRLVREVLYCTELNVTAYNYIYIDIIAIHSSKAEKGHSRFKIRNSRDSRFAIREIQYLNFQIQNSIVEQTNQEKASNF